MRVAPPNISVLLLAVSMIMLTYGQQLAVALAGFQIPIAFFVTFASLITLVALRQIEVVPRRLLLYLLAMACVVTASLAASLAGTISYSLVFFMIALYFPFAFRLASGEIYVQFLRIHQAILLSLAAVGIAQFCLQFTGVGYVTVQDFLPPNLLQEGYNYLIPLSFDSPYWKSQGVFFLEPSFYSRHLALALVIEAVTFRRPLNLIAYLGALTLAFSGTGLMVLAVAGTVHLFRRVRLLRQTRLSGSRNGKRTVAVLTLALIAMVAASPAREYFANRLVEFTKPTASGYIRFVAPYLALRDYLSTSSWRQVAFGGGAGTAQALKEQPLLAKDYEIVHPTAVVKSIMEFGILGGMGLLMFMIYSILAHARLVELSACLLIVFGALTGALVQTQTVYLCLLLGPLFAKQRSSLYWHTKQEVRHAAPLY